MKRNPLWLLIIPVIMWPLFVVYAKPVFSLKEMESIESLFVYALIISTLFVSTVFPPILWCAHKQDQRRAVINEKIDRDTNPKYANILRYNGKTPKKGEFVAMIDPDNWIIVQWDKEKNQIVVFTPPSHEDRKNLILRQWYNGKMEEVQKVRVEDLPRIS